MRKKIKEILNKEEGFTLVELLAVIVILGIIVAIAIPAIGGVVGTATEEATAAETALIEDAARLYDVKGDKITEGSGNGVTVQKLIDEGFLDLRDGDNAPSGTVEKLKVETGTGYTYEYKSSGTVTGP